MKILDIITETAAPGTREDAIIANWLKANPHLEVVEKVDPKAGNFATRWLANKKHLNEQVYKSLMVKYGNTFQFLKLAGVIAPLVLCIVNLRALEAQAQEKDSAGNYVHDIEWVKRQENAIVGVFLASQLVTVVAASIKAGAFITGLRLLATEAAIRSPGGGKGMIATMLAGQVAITALQVWMNTDQGRNWCMTGLVLPLIIGGMGALGNIGLEFLRDKVKEYSGKDIGVVTPTINQRKDDEKADNTGPTNAQISKWQDDSFTAGTGIKLNR